MRLKLFKSDTVTGALTATAAKRGLATIACLAVLSGCESLPDVPSFDEMKTGLSETYNDTVKSMDQAWNSDAAPGDSATSENEVVVSLDRPAVKRLQSRLARLGYPAGPADGVMGSKTTKAIKRYQSANNLPVSGQVSLQLLEHMEASTDGGYGRDMLTNSPK